MEKGQVTQKDGRCFRRLIFNLGLSDRDRYMADLMRVNASTILKAFKPLIVTSGFDEALVDRWLEVRACPVIICHDCLTVLT